MESYRTEEEQVEALKRWWKENGRSIVLGVVLATGAGFGWRFYQNSEQQAATNASLQFQQMLQALSLEGDLGEGQARELAAALKESHSGSTYGQFAGMHLARLAVNDGDFSSAEAALRDVLAMSRAGDDVHQVATLRLARVLAAQGEREQALTVLQGTQAGQNVFTVSFAIARGDILMLENREGEALIAYESAVAAMDQGVPVPRTLQDKIEYLAARQAGAGAEAG